MNLQDLAGARLEKCPINSHLNGRSFILTVDIFHCLKDVNSTRGSTKNLPRLVLAKGNFAQPWKNFCRPGTARKRDLLENKKVSRSFFLMHSFPSCYKNIKKFLDPANRYTSGVRSQMAPSEPHTSHFCWPLHNLSKCSFCASKKVPFVKCPPTRDKTSTS